ncbi:adenosine kinase [Coemansia interrupta]|uniref:Adenosine kinase n=1 Tax=Coemansia interrupta TaxID=1126814 RepID=A0A9W8HE30_9FUNG|nr:adenosine kinase [Coemansia interrupta]
MDSSSLTGNLVGFCNPLLDISAEVGMDFLERYGLQANDAVLATQDQLTLFSDIVAHHKPTILSGGSGQNTMRGAQLLLPPGSTMFIGAVGDDENAKQLRVAAEKAGLRTEYMVNSAKQTGTCALLVTEKGNSMVADLGAAETYNIAHLQSPHIWRMIEHARLYYITGFFLAVSLETIRAVARHSLENDKTFTMNISAPFVATRFTSQLTEMLPYVDVLFGSHFETPALSSALGLTSCDDDLALVKHLAHWQKTGPGARRVIFTTSSGVVVGSGDSETVFVYDIAKVPQSEIVDANGAGDGFVGGYLAQMMQGKTVDVCVEAGHWLSSLVLRQRGASFPDASLAFVPKGLTVSEVNPERKT